MTHFLDSAPERWAEHHPGLDLSVMEVVGLVKRISAQFSRAAEPIYQGAQLTQSEAEMLIPLRHATEPVIARSLADFMGISRAAASKTLAKLERRGLVERTLSPADRRAAVVTVTAAGKEAIDALFPRQLAAEAQLLAGLGEDREQVLRALARLAEVMEGSAAAPPRGGPGE